MKNYDDLTNRLLERRNRYVAEQKKKKQVIARTTVSVGSVALVSLASFALFKSDAFRETPPISDGGATTTTTHIPTEGEATTTTTTVNTTAPEPTTDGGIVTPPTTVTTVPAPSKPIATQAPTTGKTEPPKSTSGTKGSVTAYIPPLPTATQPTAGSDKLLITGTEPDNNIYDGDVLSNTEKYISNALQEQMDRYKGVDATYAVIVAIPIMHEDYDEDFWASTEELAQFHREFYTVYFAFEEEAKRLNPTWDLLNASEIEVWTDTMRTNYEYYLTLIDKWDDLRAQYLAPYLASVLNRRFEALKALCEKEPVDIFCQTNLNLNITHHAYYVELTADAINTLAEQGGYTFCLALKDQRDYGHWDNIIR